MTRPIIVAIGGHALLDPEQPASMENQYEVTARAMEPVADLIARGVPVVIVHGNGPQVGFGQLRSVLARDYLYEVPLDALVANTQGSLGYLIQRSLRQALLRRGVATPVATVLTEVRVDETDSAFEEPTKPIGQFFTSDEAQEMSERYGWLMVDDGHRGYRRVVSSPSPVEIVQLDVIRACLQAGQIVVCCGGGGIPVVSLKTGAIQGIEAVIDKDRVAAMLAVRLMAETLVITTAVPHVYVDFGLPSQRALRHVTTSEVRRLGADGQFPPGSMRPKMEAVLYYLNRLDGAAIVCEPADLASAVEGDAGTRIVRGP